MQNTSDELMCNRLRATGQVCWILVLPREFDMTCESRISKKCICNVSKSNVLKETVFTHFETIVRISGKNGAASDGSR